MKRRLAGIRPARAIDGPFLESVLRVEASDTPADRPGQARIARGLFRFPRLGYREQDNERDVTMTIAPEPDPIGAADDLQSVADDGRASTAEDARR